MRFHAVAAAATGLLLGNVTLASYVNFPADSVHTRDFDADLYSRDYDYETIGSDMLYARQLLDDVFELVARTPVFSERLPTSSSSSSSYRYDSGSYGYSTGSDANRAQPPPAPASVPSTSGRTSGYSTTPGTTTTPGSGSSAGRTPYQVGSDLKSGGVSLPNDARAAQDISIGTPKDKYEIGRSEAQRKGELIQSMGQGIEKNNRGTDREAADQILGTASKNLPRALPRGLRLYR